MADNYLEKKYEEYKSRKEGHASRPYNSRKAASHHKTRRVFVTGGAEGIGKAIVKTFRSAGHRVAFCDRNEAAGKETALHCRYSVFYGTRQRYIQKSAYNSRNQHADRKSVV